MKNKEVLIIQDEIVISQEDHDLILEPGDQVRVLPADEDFGVIDEPYPDEEYEDEFINEPIIVEEPEIENEYGIIIPAEGYVGDEDDLYDGFDDYEVEEDDDEVLGDYHDVANVDNVPVDIENDLYDLENSKIVVVHEDVRIKQDGHDIILERGDRIKVLSENRDRLSSVDFLISKGYVETSSSLPNNYTLIPSKGKILLKELRRSLSIDRFFESKDFFDIIGNRIFVFVGRQKFSDSSISVSTSDNTLVDSVNVSHQGIGD